MEDESDTSTTDKQPSITKHVLTAVILDTLWSLALTGLSIFMFTKSNSAFLDIVVIVPFSIIGWVGNALGAVAVYKRKRFLTKTWIFFLFVYSLVGGALYSVVSVLTIISAYDSCDRDRRLLTCVPFYFVTIIFLPTLSFLLSVFFKMGIVFFTIRDVWPYLSLPERVFGAELMFLGITVFNMVFATADLFSWFFGGLFPLVHLIFPAMVIFNSVACWVVVYRRSMEKTLFSMMCGNMVVFLFYLWPRGYLLSIWGGLGLFLDVYNVFQLGYMILSLVAIGLGFYLACSSSKTLNREDEENLSPATYKLRSYGGL